MEVLDAIVENAKFDDANILIPFISFKEEFLFIKNKILSFTESYSPNIKINIGAMIETPMSAYESDFYAVNSEFLSYGLNDLTMGAYALEREGGVNMLIDYKNKGIIDKSPFEAIRYDGMKKLLTHSINYARDGNTDVTIGICGEQVRDIKTLEFFNTLPIDYISSTSQNIPFIKYHTAKIVAKKK